MTLIKTQNEHSVLLASPSYGGTIAAVRNLGANGFKVGVISNGRVTLSAAAWSRHTWRSYAAPPETDSERFLNRLLAIGAMEPGQLLLPTSDETAWLYAEQAAELKKFFCLYQPSLSTISRILDKRLLAEAATAVGITALPSWQPRTLEEVAELAPNLPYPILIKRRTHVHRVTNHKGIVVRSMSALVSEYQRFVELDQNLVTESDLSSTSHFPFLQQFVKAAAAEGVCSVSGFVDRTGELFVTRRATKVFQRSQPVGVGVCFESLPADTALSNAVRRLCRELGYFGVFEAEFLRFNDSWALIDFNPRLFNQIGLDIRRGMPLPVLACLDAVGETAALREAVAEVEAHPEDTRTVFCDGFTLRVILAARALTGRISHIELSYWRNWIKKNAGATVDVVKDNHDRIPALIHALSELWLGVKAVPKFLRLTPRASSGIACSAMEARS